MKLDTQSYIHNLINTYHLITNSAEKQPELIQLLEQIITYYQDIIDCLPGNVYWFDKNCISVGANKNVLDMMGLTSLDQFTGLTFEELGELGKWDPSATQHFKEKSLAAINEGKFLLNIEEPPIPNIETGELLYFLSSRVPLFDRNKNIIGFCGVSINITELRKTQFALTKAKEDAERTSKHKSEFVTNMSHDIKTPLVGMIGLAEILRDQLKKQEDKELAEALHQSAKELLSFFENCLENFKRDLTTHPAQHQLFRISDILHEIKRLYEPTIFAKKLRLIIEHSESCPDFVRGNRTYLHRSLMNLVSNAIKFTHTGSISIHVSNDSHSETNHHVFIFKVTDTGMGIEEKDQQIIFNQFTKLKPSYKGTHEGHGLGLHMVDSFIKAMNGTITVSSEKNKGSTFTITIPLEVEAILPHQVSPEKIVKKTEKQEELRILIVEDHPVTQLVYQKMFASMGHTISIAETGQKAIAFVETNAFDMAFIDLGLPDIEGDEVCRQIRLMEKKEKRNPMPIVVLTAHLTEEIDAHLKEKEIDAVCSKPLSKETLAELIDSLAGEMTRC